MSASVCQNSPDLLGDSDVCLSPVSDSAVTVLSSVSGTTHNSDGKKKATAYFRKSKQSSNQVKKYMIMNLPSSFSAGGSGSPAASISSCL